MPQPMYLTFALLGTAIGAVWLPSVRVGRLGTVAPWAVALTASVVAGTLTGILSGWALATLCALVAATHVAQRTSGQTRAWLLSLTVAIALAMSLHLLPGFHNPMLYDGVQFTENAAPYSKDLSFDKAVAGLFLLVALAPRVRSLGELKSLLPTTSWVAGTTVAAVIGTAVAIGYVAFQPKLPPLAFAWFAANLLFTCVAEEVFFRGCIQEQLTRVVGQRPAFRWVPVAVAAALFGVAHAGGGWVYVALAGLAGVGYSTAYALTRRIEPSIITHFAVNAVHFLFFTYPAVRV